MARKRRPTGDDATNARKRFYRRAESYIKQAKSSVGATAARYMELAKINLDDALKTYSKSTTQKFAKPIQKIANDLGIDLGEERRKIQSRSDETAEKIRSRAIDLGEKSRSARALRTRTSEQLRQDEATALLNSPIGKRVIGGTVDIWRDAATIETEHGFEIDKKKIIPALFDYFKVDNLADLLERIETIAGDKLYRDEQSETMYETVKLLIANHTLSDNSVTS